MKVHMKDFLRPWAVPRGIRTHNSLDLLSLDVVEDEQEDQGVRFECLSLAERGERRRGGCTCYCC